MIPLLCFILLGAAGMAVGNRKVNATIKKQRWQKFFSYLLITAAVIFSIRFHFFFGLAIVIILFGYYELMQTISKTKRIGIVALIIYTILSTGFLFFAYYLRMEYQYLVYFIVLIFDAFSQITGQILGKNSLVPRISPTKTWEGFIGGILFGTASAMLASAWLNLPVKFLLVIGLFVSITSFAGDLMASYYKRRAGIKDYSNFLPGQGGFLDRFDSLIMTGFIISLFLLLEIQLDR
jgi:phosphatidate cytidylyltransferase